MVGTTWGLVSITRGRDIPSSEKFMDRRGLEYVPVFHYFFIFEHLEHVIQIAFLRGTKIDSLGV